MTYRTRHKRMTIEERFFSKFSGGADDECWPWKGGTWIRGYGYFYVERGRRSMAHSFALELATGVRCPPGMLGCHHCDNPPCVNPAHIYYGTPLQNMRDMQARGRCPEGSAKPNSKLTDEQVVSLRERYAGGDLLPELAREFGVSKGSVSEIVNGKRYRKSGGPISRGGREGPSLRGVK